MDEFDSLFLLDVTIALKTNLAANRETPWFMKR